MTNYLKMTDKDFDNPSEELKNKISDHILKSGFPLEYQVRELINKANAMVSKQTRSEIESHATFLDPDDDKSREIDVFWVIPSWHKEAPSLHYNYYFECKSSEKNSWVFFTEPIPKPSALHSFSDNMSNLQILSDLYSEPTRTIGSPIFYGHSSRLAFSYLTYPESSPDIIRSAMFQVIKPGFVDNEDYLDDLLGDKCEFIQSAALFFPIIVYSGYLFEYSLDPQTKSHKLLPAKHIIASFAHSFNRHRRIFLVDVVRSDYLPKYLDQQVQDILKIHKYMEEVKPSTTNVKISKILKQRNDF